MEKGKAAVNYLDYLGLEREPFSEGYERAFYFQDPELTQRLGMLQHFSRYSDLLLMVMGERGVGKSALLKRFVADLPVTAPACEVQATPMMDADGLMQAIAQRLHLPHGAAQSDQHLLGAINESQHPEETLLLVVDDAQDLSVEALRMLFRLADAGGGQRKLLKVIMFCEPSIQQMLADPAINHLAERITHILELNPFDEEQTGLYIQHRLRSAGLPGANPIDDKLLQRVYRHSGGNPARINAEVRQILQELARSGGKVGDGNKTFQYAVVSVVLAAVMVAAYVMREQLITFYDGITHSQTAESGATPGEEGQGTLVIGAEGEAAGKPEDNSANIPHVLKGFGDEDSTDNPSETEVKEGESVDPHAVQAEDDSSDKTPHPSGQLAEPRVKISAVSPNPVVASAARQEVTVYGKGFTRGSRVTVGWTGSVAELARWQVKYISPTELRIKITTGLEADTWTVRVIDQNNEGSNVYSFQVVKTAAGTEPQETADTQAITQARAFKPQVGQDLNWIQLQDGSHYTLQLFASDKEESVVAFIQKYNLSAQAAYFRSQRNGKDWYTLIYGEYPSRDTATVEAQSLAARIPGVKPWIRRFAEVQALLPSAAIHDEAWIRQQNRNYYNLQLLVSSDRARLEAYVKQYGLQNTAIYSAVRNGKTLYILIQGVFTNRQQADEAMARLPQEVREARPWVRSYASVQRDLDQAR